MSMANLHTRWKNKILIISKLHFEKTTLIVDLWYTRQIVMLIASVNTVQAPLTDTLVSIQLY